MNLTLSFPESQVTAGPHPDGCPYCGQTDREMETISETETIDAGALMRTDECPTCGGSVVLYWKPDGWCPWDTPRQVGLSGGFQLVGGIYVPAIHAGD